MIRRAVIPIIDDDVKPGTSTLPGLLVDAAERYGNSDWLAFNGATQSFLDLRERTDAIQRAVMASELGHGDGVALFMGNRFEWIQTQLGVLGAGAWLVPLNTWFRSSEITHILTQSRSKVLIWDATVLGRDTRPLLEELVPEAGSAGPGIWRSAQFPDLEMVVGIGASDWPPGVTDWATFLALGDQVTAAEAKARRGTITPDQDSLVIFTSGTTGVPKGAILSHTGVVDHMRTWSRHVGLRPGDRSIMASPLFWIFGCTMNTAVPLLAGSMIVLEERFTAEQFVSDIERYGCNHLQGVPDQYEMAVRLAIEEKRDLSTLTKVQIGGSIAVSALAGRLRQLAPNAVMTSSFGLTEGCGVNTWTEFDDPFEVLDSSVGHGAPDNEISVRHESTGEEVKPGEVGELWIRGPHVMKGYLNAPEATANALVDGWLRTGDLVISDDRGYISVIGRRSDAYKRGGMNVYPAETEALLASHPAVDLVALIGVPDTRLGEVGAAFVVLRPSTTCDADELVEWAQARIAAYKVPAHIRFVDELPQTASGSRRRGMDRHPDSGKHPKQIVRSTVVGVALSAYRSQRTRDHRLRKSMVNSCDEVAVAGMHRTPIRSLPMECRQNTRMVAHSTMLKRSYADS